MNDSKQAAQGSAATARKPLPWKQKSGPQKFVQVLKVIASIVSFGFLFPND
jgi:hypothetical protein